MCSELHFAGRSVRLAESLTLPLSICSMAQVQWLPSCNSIIACPRWAGLGCHLTISFGHTDVQPATPASQKRGWLPLLTVLFLISYGLMTMLIVEQGSTIENQRALIRDLFHDSAELSALKGKSVRENNAQRSGQAKSPKDSLTQDPAVQPPSTQNPSSQAVPQHRAQTHGKAQKPHVQIPSRPASDLSDDRRSVITI